MGFVALLTHEDPEGSRSNDYAQILAVFGAKAFGYKLLDSKRVGGKLYWEVSLSALVDGDIHLNVMFYGNKDATCCPSIEGKATYILDKSNQLKETGTRILGIP